MASCNLRDVHVSMRTLCRFRSSFVEQIRNLRCQNCCSSAGNLANAVC